MTLFATNVITSTGTELAEQLNAKYETLRKDPDTGQHRFFFLPSPRPYELTHLESFYTEFVDETRKIHKNATACSQVLTARCINATKASCLRTSGLQLLYVPIPSEDDDGFLDVSGWPMNKHKTQQQVGNFQRARNNLIKDLRALLSRALRQNGYGLRYNWTDVDSEPFFSMTAGLLYSLDDFLQDAHIDYDWPLVSQALYEVSHTSPASPAYADYVPFTVHIPFSRAGQYINIWPHRNVMQQRTTLPVHEATVVEIPYGVMLVARGDVIHAGSYMTSPQEGDRRMHIHIYPKKGPGPTTSAINTYNFPRQTGLPTHLQRISHHCVHVASRWRWWEEKAEGKTYYDL